MVSVNGIAEIPTSYVKRKLANKGIWSEGASLFGIGPSRLQSDTVGSLQVESRLSCCTLILDGN